MRIVHVPMQGRVFIEHSAAVGKMTIVDDLGIDTIRFAVLNALVPNEVVLTKEGLVALIILTNK